MGQVYSWDGTTSAIWPPAAKETRVHVKAASTHAGLSGAGGAAEYWCTFSESADN